MGYLIASGIRRLSLPSSPPNSERAGQSEQVSVALVQDPQCGRFIPQHEAIRLSRRGQDLYFCSPACRDEYKAT